MLSPMKPKTTRLLHLGLALYLVCCLLAVIWPGFAWIGQQRNILILGLPLTLAWYVGWIVLTFIALVAFEVLTSRTGPRSTQR
jgi:TRAP-type C4-dicarboxylate transport system permease small subunit